MSNMGQGYWECRRVEGTHTRDKREKDKILSLHTCFEFNPGFSSQRCGQIIRFKSTLNGANRWPGLLLAYFFPRDIGAFFPTGHGMVEWVQRYGCAKLSETIGLVGGLLFHRGDPMQTIF